MSSNSQKVGYIRVSTAVQNTDRQLDGIDLDKVFTDYKSGRNRARPELENAISYVREGDTLVVHSLDRLARNLRDLHSLLDILYKKGVTVHFVKNNMICTPENGPMHELMLNILGSFAQFEVDIMKERQKEGIEIAKVKKSFAGRKPLDVKIRRNVVKSHLLGMSRKDIVNTYKVSRETVRRFVQEHMNGTYSFDFTGESWFHGGMKRYGNAG